VETPFIFGTWIRLISRAQGL